MAFESEEHWPHPLWKSPVLEQVRHEARTEERAKWIAWLVKLGYPYDWSGLDPPPCTPTELGTAHYENEKAGGHIGPDENVEDWILTVQEEWREEYGPASTG
jgi:hypothetical protein